MALSHMARGSTGRIMHIVCVTSDDRIATYVCGKISVRVCVYMLPVPLLLPDLACAPMMVTFEQIRVVLNRDYSAWASDTSCPRARSGAQAVYRGLGP